MLYYLLTARMIHLLTIKGKTADRYYLDQNKVSDFKALIRSIVSGRSLLVSTAFRSDLFYGSGDDQHNDILKSWAFYGNFEADTIDNDDIIRLSGDKESLSFYFQDLCILAGNWYEYKVYRDTVKGQFIKDLQNEVARKVIECDHHLTGNCKIDRLPLIERGTDLKLDLTQDNYELAIQIKKDQSRIN